MTTFNFELIKKVISYSLKRLKSIGAERAVVTQKRLAILYAIIGWHAFWYTMNSTVLSDSSPTEYTKTKILSNAAEKGQNVYITNIEGISTIKTAMIKNDSNSASSHE